MSLTDYIHLIVLLAGIVAMLYRRAALGYVLLAGAQASLIGHNLWDRDYFAAAVFVGLSVVTAYGYYRTRGEAGRE